ncbi:hypothetical protein TOT_030000725 [Theileria orientalis strain Shintoku]|uniref:Uncharacterized protein n=1 Tax=Theileria orientalis strain Shintoku TaxID=869250 RepID=J4DPX5_THEOR|nr:hypothetical protein TOT_030000725 [Theileria orientalis strain Shintoku]PVC53796.1 hypothetical protein MACL_00003489 [Theileria orientalis]BAM41464.1 hypothetical protein TOT_030000725 [Theileria orientalis strain Shintoku]|eukprot:XP_009691765.1 hypothetical protein TOT_030000725 [Theileria orientalis strain Shintoku]
MILSLTTDTCPYHTLHQSFQTENTATCQTPKCVND